MIPEYSDVQKIAKETIEYIKTEIRPEMQLTEVIYYFDNDTLKKL